MNQVSDLARCICCRYISRLNAQHNTAATASYRNFVQLLWLTAYLPEGRKITVDVGAFRLEGTQPVIITLRNCGFDLIVTSRTDWYTRMQNLYIRKQN